MGNCLVPQVQHTTESKKLIDKLRNLLIAFVVFSLLETFLVRLEFFNNIFIIILGLFLIYNLSSLLATFLMFFLMFGVFTEIIFTLLIVQNAFFGDPFPGFVFIFEVCFIILYISLIYYSFLASKELRAIFIEQQVEQGGQVSNNYLEMQEIQGNSSQQQSNQRQGFVPFSGQGHVVG